MEIFGWFNGSITSVGIGKFWHALNVKAQNCVVLKRGGTESRYLLIRIAKISWYSKGGICLQGMPLICIAKIMTY